MEENVAHWFADYCSGEISEQDFARLRAWMDADPRNRQEFAAYYEANRATAEATLSRWLDEKEALEKHLAEIARLSARLRTRIRLRRYGFAATVVLLLALGFWLDGRKFFPERKAELVNASPGGIKATLKLPGGETIPLDQYTALLASADAGVVLERDSSRTPLQELLSGETPLSEFHTISIPRGGEYHLMLPDGSRIWLNAETELQFPSVFDGTCREIFLTGEAYLEVAEQTAQPFVVHTPRGSVRVLGTVFNLSAYPDDSRLVTSLLSGRVEVTAGGLRAELSPMQEALWQEGGQEIEVRDADVHSTIAWVKGVFEFEDLPLSEILTYLARWYDVSFEFGDPATGALHFTGGARKYAPLSDFLRMMERSCNIRFVQQGEKVRVLSNAE